MSYMAEAPPRPGYHFNGGFPSLPALRELASSPQWVTWNYVLDRATNRWNKPPLSPHTGLPCSSKDPKHWVSFEEAVEAMRKRRLAGVGYALSPDDDYTGIDLDKCRDPETGALVQWAADLLALSETYAEVSPSGTGVRMFARGKVDKAQTSKAAGIEVYADKRYLTITGHHVAGTPTSIGRAPKTLAALIARIESFKAPRTTEAVPPRSPPIEPSGDEDERLRDALAAVPNDDYWVWLFAGMALKDRYGAQGRLIWDSWSSASYKEFSPEVQATKWRSFRGTGITVGTIYHYAKDAGWKPTWWTEKDDELAAEGGRIARAFIESAREKARNVTRSARGDLIDNDTGEVLYEKPDPVVETQDWLYPGGLLGAMTDWIVETTSRRPNRPMALAAAISIVGTVLGRHLAGPTKSGTHLYIACIGETAAGKDRPMQAIGEILDAAGLGFLVISGKFKSDVALENAIADNPCSVAIIDEIGQQLFASIMGRKAGTHQANIGAILRETWPRSFKEIATSCSAARKGHKIKSPAFSIYGASTVDEFYASLSGAAVDNGFINRFLIIKAAKRAVGGRRHAEERGVPDSIIAALHRLMREADGNLDGGKLAYISQEKPVFDIMPWADDAVHAAYEKFDEEILDNEDSEIVALMSRTGEMAVRLATIHAVSRAGRSASLTMQDFEWGKAIAMHSAQIMTVDVRERMSDNDAQAKYKLIERLVREAGEISRRNLLRKLNGKIAPQEIDKIIGLLADADVILAIPAKKAPGRGRNSIRLVYTRNAKIPD